MANPFENYTFDQANDAFAKLKTALKETAANRRFMEGDDWQDGRGWVGPQFEGNNKLSRDLKSEIERSFTSKGDIKAAVRRHVRGVIGRMPGWLISSRNAPSEPDAEVDETDKQIIAEAQKVLNEFWKNSRVHGTLKEAVKDYLTNGHAILRLFFVQDAGDIDTATVEDAVKLLHLFREMPESGCVVMDKRTLKKASLFRYDEDGSSVIEICYVNDDGNTVFRKLTKNSSKEFADQNLKTIGKYIDGDTESDDEIVLPMNGKLLVFEMKGSSFISAAMRSQQKLVNKAFTMMSHNLDVDGFRSRVILNALPPGEYKDNGSGKTAFVPDENGLEVGAGKVQYVNGLPVVRKEEGKTETTYTTPGVFESQPVDVKTFTDSAAAGCEAILEEADQKHISITGDAAPSGESRKEARECFKQSLDDTKSELDDTVSDVFEAVLAIVAYLMGQDARYNDLQVSFNAILNPGPVSTEDRRVAREEAIHRFRSDESAMEEMGIADPDAMKAKIKLEDEQKPDVPPIVPPEKEKDIE